MQLQTFDGELSHFNPQNPYAGDDRTPVQFYIGAQLDQPETETKGRPIYKDTEYVRIITSKDSIVDRPVRDQDKQRWPRAYAAWKQTGEDIVRAAGTPLEAWPMITRAQVEEFKFFKIYTVEQLAESSDSSIGGVMGIQRLKTLAKAYVELSEGSEPLMRVNNELQQAKGEIAGLVDQVKQLTEALEKLMAKKAA